jgi:hypothetical protein
MVGVRITGKILFNGLKIYFLIFAIITAVAHIFKIFIKYFFIGSVKSFKIVL